MTRYNKESVLKVVNKWEKDGNYEVKQTDNQVICYDKNLKLKTIIFSETEDGNAYTQKMFNELAKKYRTLFNVKEKTYEKGEIEYIAHCVEFGEKFITKFYAPKGLSKKDLLAKGYELAQEWGGECYKVTVA